MEFLAIDLSRPLPPLSSPAVLGVHGGDGIGLAGLLTTLPERYRFVGAASGGSGETAGICFDTTRLSAHGTDDLWWDRSSRPGEAKPSVAVLRLWRSDDLATIICCCLDLRTTDPTARRRAAQLLATRIDAYGEGMPVVVLGDTADTTDLLRGDQRLINVSPDVLITPTIRAAGPAEHGPVDLDIRHRNRTLADRTWTAIGATVHAVSWWYQPERSSGSRHDTYAAAASARDGDLMGPGHISIDLAFSNPDGSTTQGRQPAGAETTCVVAGLRVVHRQYEVWRRRERLRTTDDPADALKNGQARDADEVRELLTLGQTTGAMTVRGNDLRIRPKIDL